MYWSCWKSGIKRWGWVYGQIGSLCKYFQKKVTEGCSRYVELPTKYIWFSKTPAKVNSCRSRNYKKHNMTIKTTGMKLGIPITVIINLRRGNMKNSFRKVIELDETRTGPPVFFLHITRKDQTMGRVIDFLINQNHYRLNLTLAAYTEPSQCTEIWRNCSKKVNW